MITLSNNHSFEYMAASGALAFNGQGWPWEQPLRLMGLLDPSLFTVVIKTLTHAPRKGNLKLYKPFTCIRFLKNGTVNAVGLTNPGVVWWCHEVGPRVQRNKQRLVGSIFSDSIDELVRMAHMMNDFDLVGLEINASCPNTKDDLLANTQKVIDACHAVKASTRLPLLLKVSVTHDLETLIPGTHDVIEAYSINSVPWARAYPNTASPLAHLGGGGVSGKIAQRHTWGTLEKIASLTNRPVIGPSIWNYEDIAEVRKRGASAIGFGSIFLRYPWRPTLFVRKDMEKYDRARNPHSF